MNSGTLESSTSTRDHGHDRTVRHRPLEQPRVERVDGVEDASSPSTTCSSCRARCTFSQRAASIGVSVKLTSSDTMIANAIVSPKLYMKRPTMPPMNATGRKTATSDSVVASTARPISRVASTAAWNGSIVLLLDEPVDVLEHDDRVVDHDADRQRQREQRDRVEREAHEPDQAEGRDDRRRDRDRGDDVERRFARNTSTTSAARSEPTTRCSSTLSIDASMNSDEVAHDADVVAGRQRRLDLVEPLA